MPFGLFLSQWSLTLKQRYSGASGLLRRHRLRWFFQLLYDKYRGVSPELLFPLGTRM